MSHDPDSEWTFGTLKQYVDVRFDAVKEAISKADTVGETRAIKLETETRTRFESVNEFRNQQRDIIGNFMPRAEFDARSKALDEKLAAGIKSMEDKISAKNMQVVMSLAVGFVAVLIAVFNFASRF